MSDTTEHLDASDLLDTFWTLELEFQFKKYKRKIGVENIAGKNIINYGVYQISTSPITIFSKCKYLC